MKKLRVHMPPEDAESSKRVGDHNALDLNPKHSRAEAGAYGPAQAHSVGHLGELAVGRAFDVALRGVGRPDHHDARTQSGLTLEVKTTRTARANFNVNAKSVVEADYMVLVELHGDAWASIVGWCGLRVYMEHRYRMKAGYWRLSADRMNPDLDDLFTIERSRGGNHGASHACMACEENWIIGEAGVCWRCDHF